MEIGKVGEDRIHHCEGMHEAGQIKRVNWDGIVPED